MGDRITLPSHWPDHHWTIPLVQFADEAGNIPQMGQFVPQEVIDRLAAFEDLGMEPEELRKAVDYWKKTMIPLEELGIEKKEDKDNG